MTFPDMVPLAIPIFLTLLAIEIVLWRITGRGSYETRDTAASLTMGLGNSIVGGTMVALIYGAFSAVHSIAIFDIGFQCQLSDDLRQHVSLEILLIIFPPRG